MYSIGKKIGVKIKVYIIRMKMSPKTIVYSFRMKIRPKTIVYSSVLGRKLDQKPKCVVLG